MLMHAWRVGNEIEGYRARALMSACLCARDRGAHRWGEVVRALRAHSGGEDFVDVIELVGGARKRVRCARLGCSMKCRGE